jgi:four helix bundle protein
MATIKRFEELEIWRLARSLSKDIWNISLQGSFSKDFNLKNQVNAAGGSTMDNIAEGFDRAGNKEFINFLSIARASNSEVRSQIARAYDRGHINDEEFKDFTQRSVTLGAKITRLMNRLGGSGFRGSKFKYP